MERDKFFIGVNAIVIRDGKILLGKRKNCFGAGEYGLPGGHVEGGEKLDEALSRELLEETGMVCRSFTISNIVNCPGTKGNYLQVGFIVHDFTGEPVLAEPEKCESWEWFDLNNLPDNIIKTHKPQIKGYVENINYLELT